ncbi:MAG: DUF1189 family protein [Bacilli bacterium]|jgi:maltodextrin utilization protein YvdJ
MFKIFRNSFRFTNIYSLRKGPIGKFIAYYLLIILVVSFPLNYQIFQSDGFQGLTQFTHYLRNHLEVTFIDELPNSGEISRNGFSVFPDQEYRFLAETEDGTFTLILNPETEIKEATDTIVLDDEKTVYFNNNGDYITGDYLKVKEALNFGDLKNMDRVQAKDKFFALIDSTFNKYAVFYSIFFNTIIQYLLNTFLILVLAVLMLLIKINFERVTNFSENLKIVIASMTIPSILAFIASLIRFEVLNPFFVVIFQFLTPIIAVLSVYKGRKTKRTDIVASK